VQAVQAFCGCTKANNVGSEGEEGECDKTKVRTFTWLVKDVIKREGTISYALREGIWGH